MNKHRDRRSRYAVREAAVPLALLLVLFPASATGHEFWIEPSAFHAVAGEEVRLHLRVGEAFQGEVVPRVPAWIRSFTVMGPEGRKDVDGEAFTDPAGVVVAPAVGSRIIAYHSHPSFITHAPERFEAYLREEGLERILALRAESGESGQATTEAFARCAKSLLVATGGASLPAAESDEHASASVVTAPIGLELELVPLADPAGIAIGGRLPVQLLYEGQPVQGALVLAWSRQALEKRLEARSDERGRCEFELGNAGPWLVSAVHMVRAEEGLAAEWKSLWASLTFEIID